MTPPPLITVIIVVYNGDKTLSECIDSILSQTYQPIELVIIDGGSTDGTNNIIKNYGDRVAYTVSEIDRGVYDAMNKGIAAAKGEWLIFLGADDRFYTATVVEEIFSVDTSEADLIYGDVEFTTNGKRFGGEKDLNRLIEKNICHQAIFYRKNIFDKLGGYNLKYPVLADFEMNIRIFEDASLRKKYVPMIIAYFNNRGLSSQVLDRYFHADMLDKFLHTDHLPFLAPQLQEYHFYHGLIGLLSKKIGTGLRHIPASWISGKRKLFYFLYTMKFMLRILTGNKISIREGKQ